MYLLFIIYLILDLKTCLGRFFGGYFYTTSLRRYTNPLTSMIPYTFIYLEWQSISFLENTIKDNTSDDNKNSR